MGEFSYGVDGAEVRLSPFDMENQKKAGSPENHSEPKRKSIFQTFIFLGFQPFIFQGCTPLKTNMSPENRWNPKMYFVLKWSLFRGHVSFLGVYPFFDRLFIFLQVFFFRFLEPTVRQRGGSLWFYFKWAWMDLHIFWKGNWSTTIRDDIYYIYIYTLYSYIKCMFYILYTYIHMYIYMYYTYILYTYRYFCLHIYIYIFYTYIYVHIYILYTYILHIYIRYNICIVSIYIYITVLHILTLRTYYYMYNVQL